VAALTASAKATASLAEALCAKAEGRPTYVGRGFSPAVDRGFSPADAPCALC